MSDTKKDLTRAWVEEAPYILVYNALRAHDAVHGTCLANDPGFPERVAMWTGDGVPFDLQDEAQRLALFKLLFWDAVKDRVDNDSRKEDQASAA